MFFFVCTVFFYFWEAMHNFIASFVLGKVERKLARKHGLNFMKVVAFSCGSEIEIVICNSQVPEFSCGSEIVMFRWCEMSVLVHETGSNNINCIYSHYAFLYMYSFLLLLGSYAEFYSQFWIGKSGEETGEQICEIF